MSRAIVVDDSKAVRMILARTLKEIGYEVEHADNGRVGLDVLNGNPSLYDLALVDWNMPEMNGMELLLALRADLRFSNLIIVMVTTETEVGRMAAALEAGANEYVMKPFTRDILIEKLQMTGLPVHA